MKRLLVSSLACACLIQAAWGDSVLQRHTITVDDFDRVQDVSDPQVSPDGQWVAYVVSANDREADEAHSAIWMVSWDGHQQVRLTNPSSDSEKPRWSPDGHYLAYVGQPAGAESAQIMVLDRRGGEARQVSKITGEISEFEWAPDGRRLVLALRQIPEEKTPKPIVIEGWHFKQDHVGYLRAGVTVRLYLLDVDSGKLDALTTDPQFTDDNPAWSPDGKQIAFIRSREAGSDRDGRSDLDVIDAHAGASPKTLARIYTPNAQKLAWSHDGSRLAFLQGLEPKYNAYMLDRLFLIAASGGTARPLTDSLDRAVMSYAFSTDSASILISVEDDRTLYPARIDLATGRLTREGAAGKSVITSISTAADHTAVLMSDDRSLAEIHALEGGQLRKLTTHNDAWLAEVNIAPTEDVSFRNRSGQDIHGLLVKPPDYAAGRRYPLLLWIHGGPNGQDQHMLALDGYEFEPQFFAARGFLVLRVNYRGGTGRGEQFARAIYADWGHKEVEDLLAGVDFAITQGLADPERLAIGGWSYGGILTDYIIATDRRFKVAIAGAGSADQIATFGADQYVLQYTHELGPPWANTALWLKVSYPFFHADRIRTPTLFVGGEKDFNVPIIGSEQMYEALRVQDVPAQLVVYPGEHHVFVRPSFIRDLAEREAAWIDRFITAANAHP